MAQLTLDLPHRPAQGREDFLVTGCNSEAVAWLDRSKDWPGGLFVIHGPSGSGKTHLLQVWRAQSGARPLKPSELAGSAENLSRGESFALDDADRIAGDSAGEEGLFHLINAVKSSGSRLLLTARTPPARWPVELADLASRLKAAATTPLGAPDDSLIQGLMLKLFSDRQLRVTPELLAYLGSRMERSFAAAADLVAALDAAALRDKKEITVPLARRVLREMQEREKD